MRHLSTISGRQRGNARSTTRLLGAAVAALLAICAFAAPAGAAPPGSGAKVVAPRVAPAALAALRATGGDGTIKVIEGGISLIGALLHEKPTKDATPRSYVPKGGHPEKSPAPSAPQNPSQMPAASAGTNGTSFQDQGVASSKVVVAHSLSSVDGQESGPTTTLVNGIALAPPSAPEPIKRAINAANMISRTPYVWGGGHGSWYSNGYDCSGAVSFALWGAGMLSSPQTSGGLESWGVPGPGRWPPVYASDTHAYAVIAGLRWDTVGDARGSGPRWHPNREEGAGFVARHYPGY
jgi:hypothetical protein